MKKAVVLAFLALSGCVSGQYHAVNPSAPSVYAANKECGKAYTDVGREMADQMNPFSGAVGALVTTASVMASPEWADASAQYNACMLAWGWAPN